MSVSLQNPRKPSLSPSCFAFSPVSCLPPSRYAHCTSTGCTKASLVTSFSTARTSSIASLFSAPHDAYRQKSAFLMCLPHSKLDTIVQKDVLKTSSPSESVSQRFSEQSNPTRSQVSTRTRGRPQDEAFSSSSGMNRLLHKQLEEKVGNDVSDVQSTHSRHRTRDLANSNFERIDPSDKDVSHKSDGDLDDNRTSKTQHLDRYTDLSRRRSRTTNSRSFSAITLEDAKSLEYMAVVNKDESLWDVYVDDVQNGHIEINVNEFASVVSSLTRQKRLGQALATLRLAERGPLAEAIGKNKSIKLCTMMIDIYGKSYQLSRAFALFYGMTRNGIKPNVITYNAMVAACARSNEPDLAYEVFEEMKVNGLEPDKFTFGALIDSFAKSGQVERAFEMSRLMDSSGVPKDQTIYSALMDACGRTEQLERALMVFEEMKQKGVWPNLVTFSVLIDTCANAREPHRAFQLYSELKHWGYPTANVIVFTSLIDACAKSGWPERAELVMKTMISQGIKPNEVSFGALVESWAQQGHLEEAFGVIDRMVDDHNLLPNEVLIGGLIDACRRARETHRVAALWEIVVKYNLRPAKTYYPPLIAMAIKEDVTLATTVLLHAYARGFLRRAALNSEDPTLHAMACAIVYYRHEIIKKGRMENVLTKRKKATRMATVFKSIAMSDADMDRMSPSEALTHCIAWGDNASRGSLGVRQRNGSRRDKKGVYRKDISSSAAAKRAKDAAAAASKRSRYGRAPTGVQST